MIYTKEQLQEVRLNLIETANGFPIQSRIPARLQHAAESVRHVINAFNGDFTCPEVVHSHAILSGWKKCPYCNKQL